VGSQELEKPVLGSLWGLALVGVQVCVQVFDGSWKDLLYEAVLGEALLRP
jgi:hypothetical protein